MYIYSCVTKICLKKNWMGASCPGSQAFRTLDSKWYNCTSTCTFVLRLPGID